LSTTTTGASAHQIITAALRGVDQYEEQRLLDPRGYSRWVESRSPDEFGLNRDQLSLSTRFPADEETFVDDALAALRRAGLVAAVDYPKSAFEDFRSRVDSGWDHGGRTTYIFPEEARLLYALAHIVGGRHWLFGGSYYGYWAIWAAPGVAAHGGSLTLVDIDEDVTALAASNFAELVPSADVRFSSADATEPLAADESVDVFVLDAEGPKDHPDPELRDKAIYAPIMRANTPVLRPGGLLVAHNMLLDDHSDCAYFAEKVAHNRRQYADFEAHLTDAYDTRLHIESSEGVGVYRRAGH